MTRRNVLLVLLAVGLGGVNAWAASPAGQYTVSAGTVKDNRSGLTWQQGYNGTMNWTTADNYCKALTLGGHTWRLPSKFELETLVDVVALSPAIDLAIFTGTPPGFFWTSTPVAGASDSMWFVDFDSGHSGGGSSAAPYFVRCVRS